MARRAGRRKDEIRDPLVVQFTRREAQLLLVLYAPDEEPAWMVRHTRR